VIKKNRGFDVKSYAKNKTKLITDEIFFFISSFYTIIQLDL